MHQIILNYVDSFCVNKNKDENKYDDDHHDDDYDDDDDDGHTNNFTLLLMKHSPCNS